MTDPNPGEDPTTSEDFHRRWMAWRNRNQERGTTETSAESTAQVDAAVLGARWFQSLHLEDSFVLDVIARPGSLGSRQSSFSRRTTLHTGPASRQAVLLSTRADPLRGSEAPELAGVRIHARPRRNGNGRLGRLRRVRTRWLDVRLRRGLRSRRARGVCLQGGHRHLRRSDLRPRGRHEIRQTTQSWGIRRPKT